MWCNPRGPFPNTSEAAGHGNAVSCAVVQTWLQRNSHLDPLAQVRPEPVSGDNLLLPPSLHSLSPPPFTCCWGCFSVSVLSNASTAVYGLLVPGLFLQPAPDLFSFLAFSGNVSQAGGFQGVSSSHHVLIFC